MDLNDQFIDGLADEYSNYFKLDTSPQLKQIEESIEENLTHLEEFCTMIDLIRNENNSNLSNLVPDFNAKKQQLRLVYAKIDKLLELVDSVKSTVDLMDEQLTQAEVKFNQNSKSSKFTKFFSNLIGTGASSNIGDINNQPSTSSLDPKLSNSYQQFQPPSIFSTQDFFLSDS